MAASGPEAQQETKVSRMIHHGIRPCPRRLAARNRTHPLAIHLSLCTVAWVGVIFYRDCLPRSLRRLSQGSPAPFLSDRLKLPTDSGVTVLMGSERSSGTPHLYPFRQIDGRDPGSCCGQEADLPLSVPHHRIWTRGRLPLPTIGAPLLTGSPGPVPLSPKKGDGDRCGMLLDQPIGGEYHAEGWSPSTTTRWHTIGGEVKI